MQKLKTFKNLKCGHTFRLHIVVFSLINRSKMYQEAVAIKEVTNHGREYIRILRIHDPLIIDNDGTEHINKCLKLTKNDTLSPYTETNKFENIHAYSFFTYTNQEPQVICVGMSKNAVIMETRRTVQNTVRRMNKLNKLLNKVRTFKYDDGL